MKSLLSMLLLSVLALGLMACRASKTQTLRLKTPTSLLMPKTPTSLVSKSRAVVTVTK